MVIQVEVNQSCICMNVGKGSNTHSEMMDFGGLKFFSKSHGIGLQMVLGDSHVIIE